MQNTTTKYAIATNQTQPDRFLRYDAGTGRRSYGVTLDNATLYNSVNGALTSLQRAVDSAGRILSFRLDLVEVEIVDQPRRTVVGRVR